MVRDFLLARLSQQYIMAAQTRLTHQSSADRKATQQPVEALLHASDILEALGWQAFGISVGARNPINKWRTWGTLLNRKVEVKPSKVPGAGRVVWSGPWCETPRERPRRG